MEVTCSFPSPPFDFSSNTRYAHVEGQARNEQSQINELLSLFASASDLNELAFLLPFQWLRLKRPQRNASTPSSLSNMDSAILPLHIGNESATMAINLDRVKVKIKWIKNQLKKQYQDSGRAILIA